MDWDTDGDTIHVSRESDGGEEDVRIIGVGGIAGAGLLALNTGLPERDSATRVADAVPEIYEDIDFYLWLADQQDEPADKHGDPANST